MKVLLDENFPLGLFHRLRAQGIDVDHVITLGWRGASDRELRDRLHGDDVCFLTQDAEFLTAETAPFRLIVVSRVRQSRTLADRIWLWERAISGVARSSAGGARLRIDRRWSVVAVDGRHSVIRTRCGVPLSRWLRESRSHE